jgi:hypothetical protein
MTPNASRLRAISGISLASRSRRTGPSTAIARPAASAALRVESQASSGDPSSPDADVTRNSPSVRLQHHRDMRVERALCQFVQRRRSASDPRTSHQPDGCRNCAGLNVGGHCAVRGFYATAVRTLLWSSRAFERRAGMCKDGHREHSLVS